MAFLSKHVFRLSALPAPTSKHSHSSQAKCNPSSTVHHTPPSSTLTPTSKHIYPSLTQPMRAKCTSLYPNLFPYSNIHSLAWPSSALSPGPITSNSHSASAPFSASIPTRFTAGWHCHGSSLVSDCYSALPIDRLVHQQ